MKYMDFKNLLITGPAGSDKTTSSRDYTFTINSPSIKGWQKIPSLEGQKCSPDWVVADILLKAEKRRAPR